MRLTLLTALTLIVVIAGLGLNQFRTTMDTLHAISTPPPVVVDNTVVEDVEASTGASIPAPIEVDTGPATDYLEAQREAGLLADLPDSGSTISNLIGNSGDAFNSAVSALGMSGGMEDSITILLMGVDARPGAAIDIGVRPDVLALLRLDRVTNGCRALSIPRDTRVELPGYGKSKINHALMIGGIPYQLRVVEEFAGVEIDHYLLIDFVGFERIVDEIGGITVTIDQDLVKNDKVEFQAGVYHFDGATALRYARFRSVATDQDIGRVERQWDLLKGISESLSGRDIVAEVTTLLPAVEGHIRTDMSAELMTEIVRAYGGTCSSPSEADAAVLRGSLVQFRDPILEEVVYYNVVSDERVAESVATLYASLEPNDPSEDPNPQSTPLPMSSPSASPIARVRTELTEGRFVPM